MKDTEKTAEFVVHSGMLMPANPHATKIIWDAVEGEVLTMKELKGRDIAFHRCYFALISYIWGLMPAEFHRQIPLAKFHHWLKHLKGQYDVLFEFKDGTKLVEYESISFGRMNQHQFESYIREQLPFIYEDVIRPVHKEKTDEVIDKIENEFKKFLSKL